MEELTIKKKRKIAEAWLETPHKESYSTLMEKMQATDFRGMIIRYAIQHYHGYTIPEMTPEIQMLQNYYSHPLKYEKEILTL